MNANITRAPTLALLALGLASCGSGARTTVDAEQPASNQAVAEETIPVGQSVSVNTGGASVAPVGQVQSRMPDMTAPPPAIGVVPVTSRMPQVITQPVAAQPAPATVPAAEQVEAPVAVAASGPSRESITSGQVCAAAIGMLFGRDPSGMEVVSDAGTLARVKYRRSDQTTWTNECRVTNRTVTWRAIGADGPGRWRTEDEITYSATTAGLAMTVNGETRAFAR